MRVIQVFNRQAENAAEFAAINDEYYFAALRLNKVFGTFSPLLSLLSSLAVAAVLWLGGSRVMAGTLTFGTLYAFTSYLRRMYDPISALAEKYNILQSALAASERITELQQTRPQVADPPSTAPPAPARGEAPAVAFDGVWFAYKKDEWVLADVSFQVMPGETVAFVGQTGAGKSTIMNLVPRFYDVQRGSVRVHGGDVREMAQRDLRRTVGIVMQDVFLFASDIAENISLGNDAIALEDVRRAATVVGADAFVERLADGYGTQVVERGQNLSTGQRQMVSFARTLAYDPDVLILDEATSSVDSETEDALRKAIRALTSGRTTLIVAHRLATVRDADRIYVMHRGRIVEQGRHAELLALGGVYSTLWRLQYESGAA
jgi:ABC-type multidrug transport system fused ATPase/permease subunit